MGEKMNFFSFHILTKMQYRHAQRKKKVQIRLILSLKWNSAIRCSRCISQSKNETGRSTPTNQAGWLTSSKPYQSTKDKVTSV